MLGEEVVAPALVVQTADSHDGTPDQRPKSRNSEFDGQIRPDSARSNRDVDSTIGTKSPDTKRKRVKSAKGGRSKPEDKKLKKRNRSKSKDKLISKEKQKEILDELKQESNNNDDYEDDRDENVVCEVNKNDDDYTFDTSGMLSESTVPSGDVTLNSSENQQPDVPADISQGKLSTSSSVDHKRLDRETSSGQETNKNGDGSAHGHDENVKPEVASATSSTNNDSSLAVDSDAKNEGLLDLPEGCARERRPSYDGRREDTMLFLDMARKMATPPPPEAVDYDLPTSDTEIHWDLDEHSSNMVLDPHDPHRVVRSQTRKSTDGARTNKGFLRGRHEFAIKFIGNAWGSHCSVGVCTAKAKLQRKGYDDLLGYDKHSWGWDIPSGDLIHNGESCGTKGGVDLSDMPRNIGVVLDRDEGTLSFVLDGNYANAMPAFTGLDIQAVKRPLYIAVSTVYPGMEITIRKHEEAEDDERITPPATPRGEQIIEQQIPDKVEKQKPVIEQEHLQWTDAGKNDDPIESDGKSAAGEKEHAGRNNDPMEDDGGLSVGEKERAGTNDDPMEDDEKSVVGGKEHAERKDNPMEDNEKLAVGEKEHAERNDDPMEGDEKFAGGEKELTGEPEEEDGDSHIESVTYSSENGEQSIWDVNKSVLEREYQNAAKEDVEKKDAAEHETVGYEDIMKVQEKSKDHDETEKEVTEDNQGQLEQTTKKEEPQILESEQIAEEQVGDHKGQEEQVDGEQKDTEQGIEETTPSERTLDIHSTREIEVTTEITTENTEERKGEETVQKEVRPVHETAFSSYKKFTSDREKAQTCMSDNEDDVEEVPSLDLSSLDIDDRYMLQIAYGWDSTLKAAKLEIYPGVPYLCVVQPNFGEKFLGVRCRRTVKTGCHRWRVREVHMNINSEDPIQNSNNGTLNNLIIGVVNGEHRTFNYGYSLSQIGRHAWGFEPKRRRLWNGSSFQTFPTVEGEQNEEEGLDLDLRRGLDIVMDCGRKKLSFEYGGEVFDTSNLCKVFGTSFSPFIVFNGLCRAPVKIEYVSGAEEEICNTLESLKKMKPLYWPDFAGYRPASTIVLSTQSIQTLEERHSGNYAWGLTSSGVVKNAMNEITFTGTNRQVAVSEMPLPSGRHIIDLELNGVANLTIGLVTAGAAVERLVNDASLLGGGLDSWAWFVPGGWLVHAGHPIGKYPYMVKDYDPTSVSTIRMVITITSSGSIVAFSATSTEAGNLDLGQAMFHLPTNLRVVVTGSVGEKTTEGSSVKMIYKSGPSGFAEQLMSLSSRVCTIL